jgi:hypothetical protein
MKSDELITLPIGNKEQLETVLRNQEKELEWLRREWVDANEALIRHDQIYLRSLYPPNYEYWRKVSLDYVRLTRKYYQAKCKHEEAAIIMQFTKDALSNPFRMPDTYSARFNPTQR